MHKLAKGLKKKKKGKKSKHKEEELFKPEELEAYRREHATGEGSAKNEEWKNFLSLTSGVDDILKKTQDDLDRIKSTSFFQRIPPPSETEAKRVQQEQQDRASAGQQQVESAAVEQEIQLGIVQVSESESDEEDEDDIFDTAYIDAIATGEVKLAYIPDSPTDKQGGDDPFDTSIAERAILGPAVERKGKKLVPLGAAVEVLTGRVQLPTCATKAPSSRRQILKQQDLLLGSFDSNAEPPLTTSGASASPEQIKTLLDDDEIPLPDEPIDLSKTLYIPPPQLVEAVESKSDNQQILNEFEEDEDDKEFEALAAESLSKGPVNPAAPVIFPVAVDNIKDWKPFAEENNADNFEVDNSDPFDTTFAENILPGKAELKLIEKEILENDIGFDPRAVEVSKFSQIADRVPESNLNLITPVHRDLLGGSTSDLSNLADKPILPTEEECNDELRYCDPFDTSIVDVVKAPGQAELKCIEKELLSDIKPLNTRVPKTISVDDDDFNPRASETTKPRTLSRPDVLNVGQSKSVSFSVPQSDLLTAGDNSKNAKPLTPFYVRKNSVPGVESPDSVVEDPFDTSFVPSLAPGKTELRLIENELFQAKSVSEDQDIVTRKEEAKPKPVTLPVDLLSARNDITAKVLTPSAEIKTDSGELSYADPFDTSIAKNILPGKAELKLLENELIQDSSKEVALESQKDLLVHTGDTIIEKPLSPELENAGSLDPAEPENFDPFDTSFASNIQPGRAELKVLESELI